MVTVLCIAYFLHEGGMEEELVGQIFEAMMISASGEGFVPFSTTRGGRVATIKSP
jgi:hypothetical protein